MLKKTWRVFFSRFGRLLPVQEAVIPAVLAGRNVIVCSPTATGKTEAVVAPVCELLTGQAVYVAPTRALVNDLAERLETPLRELDISFAAKSGDRPTFKPAQFTLTTPESLDSIVSRRPGALRDLQFLILDEIHLLDGTARGDQLRVLIRRLPKAQYAALSATLSTPEATAARYFTPFEVISADGARGIEFTYVRELGLLRREFLDRGVKKAIFFCNTRRGVEKLAADLREILPADKVYAHHGSLSRAERVSVEEAMRDGRIGFAVATMTLEFGIDIGDVDAVVLVDVPDSVSSLLQRLGRGNRREGRCVGFALEEHRKPIERLLRSDIERKEYAPNLSVVVQQIFSMVYRGALEREPLLTLCDERTLDSILAHLHKTGYLEDGRMTEKLADLAERGVIHSNIAGGGGWKVVDMKTLQPIGETTGGAKGSIALAGRMWSIRRRDAAERTYYVLPSGAAVEAVFGSKVQAGAFASFLPKALQDRSP